MESFSLLLLYMLQQTKLHSFLLFSGHELILFAGSRSFCCKNFKISTCFFFTII